MDPIGAIPLLTGGGPMAVIAALIGVIALQFLFQIHSYKKINELEKAFTDFKIDHASHQVTKEDLAADLSAINATLGQLFDLHREQNGQCGRSCTAIQQLNQLNARRP